MTLAYDAFTSSLLPSFTHTPVGAPRSVYVFAYSNSIGPYNPSDDISSVTYGGVSLARVDTRAANDGSSEGARVWAYFLGAAIPTGAQTVAINGGTRFFCITLTGDADTEVVASSGYSNGSPGTTTITLAELVLGSRTSFVAMVWGNGGNSVNSTTPSSGWSSLFEIDMGSQTGGTYKYDTIGSTNVTPSFTESAAEDTCAIAFAVAEIASAAKAFAALRAFPRPILNF